MTVEQNIAVLKRWIVSCKEEIDERKELIKRYEKEIKELEKL